MTDLKKTHSVYPPMFLGKVLMKSMFGRNAIPLEGIKSGENLMQIPRKKTTDIERKKPGHGVTETKVIGTEEGKEIDVVKTLPRGGIILLPETETTVPPETTTLRPPGEKTDGVVKMTGDVVKIGEAGEGPGAKAIAIAIAIDLQCLPRNLLDESLQALRVHNLLEILQTLMGSLHNLLDILQTLKRSLHNLLDILQTLRKILLE